MNTKSPLFLRTRFSRLVLSLLAAGGLAVGCAQLLEPSPTSELGRSNAELNQEVKQRVAQGAASEQARQYEVSLVPQPRTGNPSPTPVGMAEVTATPARRNPKFIVRPPAFGASQTRPIEPSVSVEEESGEALPILAESQPATRSVESSVMPLKAGGAISSTGMPLGTSTGAAPAPANPGAPVRPTFPNPSQPPIRPGMMAPMPSATPFVVPPPPTPMPTPMAGGETSYVRR